jgi:hypothetical protein
MIAAASDELDLIDREIERAGGAAERLVLPAHRQMLAELRGRLERFQE